MPQYTRFLIICVSLFLTFNGFAQELAAPSVSPDRPGGTVRPAKLDKGLLNLELGARFSSFKLSEDEGLDAQNYAALLRYGLLERLEINVGWAYNRADQLGSAGGVSGLGPLSTGIKLGVAEEKGASPRIEFEAVLTHAHLGKEAFRPADTEPFMNFNFAHQLTDQTNINYALGMFWEGAEEAAYYGFMLIHSFSPRLSAFAETYGFVRGDFNGEPHLGGGLMYLLNDRFQIDCSADLGRNDGNTLFHLEVGMAARLKN